MNLAYYTCAKCRGGAAASAYGLICVNCGLIATSGAKSEQARLIDKRMREIEAQAIAEARTSGAWTS